MSNYKKCVRHVKTYTETEKDLSKFWIPTYEQILSEKVVTRIFDVAVVLESNEKANVFCQRALSDLLEDRNLVMDGNLDPDLVNETKKIGIDEQLALVTVHYATNYVQNRVRSDEYGKYLRRFFR